MRNETALGIHEEGIREALLDLQKFEPNLYRQLQNKARQGAKEIKQEAEIIYDGGAWTVTGAQVTRIRKRGILASVQAAGGARIDNDWSGSDPGVKASIYEFIGKKYRGDRTQVTGLIRTLDARYRPISEGGRILWNAFDSEKGGRIMESLTAAVMKATAQLNARLNSEA